MRTLFFDWRIIPHACSS